MLRRKELPVVARYTVLPDERRTLFTTVSDVRTSVLNRPCPRIGKIGSLFRHQLQCV